MKLNKFAPLMVLLFASAQATASGFEKSIMFGGQSAGLAGIATPYTEGSEALYFNPAGIAHYTRGAQDVSLNVSPTRAKFKGPINNSGDVAESDGKILYPFSLIYARNLTDSFALALGVYTSAGSDADYKDVSFSGIKGDSQLKTDLTVTEVALGASWRATDAWSFGAAWRMVMAQADFDAIERSGPAVVNVHVHDLKDTEYTGFKLGAQYKLSDSTRFGLTYRSQVNLHAKGTISATVHTPASSTDTAGGDATAYTVFPQAVTLGAQQTFGQKWKLLAEYVWTNYAKVDNIFIAGQTGTIKDPSLSEHWNNQSNIRVAAECDHWNWPIRFGYVWTSQVTRNELASPAFTPPGAAHTLTLGTGQKWTIGQQSVVVNGGLEYTFAKGQGHGAVAGATSGDVRDGDYAVNEVAAHLGVDYTF
jgi:long-chain fatty acid transport protein